MEKKTLNPAKNFLRLLTWREIWELNWLWKKSEELGSKDAESEKVLLSKIWPNFFSWEKHKNLPLDQEKDKEEHAGCQKKNCQKKVQLFDNVGNTMLYTFLSQLEWARAISSLTTTKSFRQAAHERNYFYQLLNSFFESEALETQKQDKKETPQAIRERCLIFCQILENLKGKDFPKSGDWVFVIDQVIATPQTFFYPTFFLNCKLSCSILVWNHVFWLSEHLSGFPPSFSRFNNPMPSTFEESKTCSIVLRPSCCLEKKTKKQTQIQVKEPQKKKEKIKTKKNLKNEVRSPNASASVSTVQSQLHSSPTVCYPTTIGAGVGIGYMRHSGSPFRPSSRSPLFQKRSTSLPSSPQGFARMLDNSISKPKLQPQASSILAQNSKNSVSKNILSFFPLKKSQSLPTESFLHTEKSEKRNEKSDSSSQQELEKKEKKEKKLEKNHEIRKIWAICFGANTDTLPFIHCLDCDVCHRPFCKADMPLLELVYLQASPVVRLGSLSASRLSGNVPLIILEDASLEEFKGLTGDQYLLILNNPDETIKKISSFKTQQATLGPVPVSSFFLFDMEKVLGAPKYIFLERKKKKKKIEAHSKSFENLE